jgi:hypothetical protein
VSGKRLPKQRKIDTAGALRVQRTLGFSYKSLRSSAFAKDEPWFPFKNQCRQVGSDGAPTAARRYTIHT